MIVLKKTVDFLTLQYVKISIKTPFLAIDKLKKINTSITFVKLMIAYRNVEAPS